jgi:hypothetical protein
MPYRDMPEYRNVYRVTEAAAEDGSDAVTVLMALLICVMTTAAYLYL